MNDEHDGQRLFGVVILLGFVGCVIYYALFYEPPPLRVRVIKHYSAPLAERMGEEVGKEAHRFGKGLVKGWNSEKPEKKEGE